jgi:protein tyrosine phosphatase
MGSKKLALGFAFLGLFCAPFCSPISLYAENSSFEAIEKELSTLSAGSQSWLEEQAVDVSDLKKQAGARKKIKPIFEKISQITNHEIKKTIEEASKPEFLPKNRHPAFLPSDENRTCRHLPNFYISASDVVTQNYSYIVSQGPIADTIEDFWIAILEKKSPLVVSLVMAQEEGKDKCLEYWEEGKTILTRTGWEVTLSPQQEILGQTRKDQRLVKRLFLAKNKETEDERTIYHLHYENWPDNGVPELDLFSKLLDSVDTLKIATNAPIVVHCSAGIGRSGTFLASYSLRKDIRDKKAENIDLKSYKINIPRFIMELRFQRRWLVPAAKQLQTVYQIAAKEFE